MESIKKSLDKAHKKVVQPFIDTILGRTMSKKLLVFFLATLFVLRDTLTGDQWVTIAEWYFGSQGAVDITEAITSNYKRGGGS